MQERATNQAANLANKARKTIAFPQPEGDGYGDTWLAELMNLVEDCMARAGVESVSPHKAA